MSATCNKKPLARPADTGESSQNKKTKTKWSKYSYANDEVETQPSLDLLHAQREQVLRGTFLKERARDLPITKVQPNPFAAYPDGPLYKRFAKAHTEVTSSLGGLGINLGFHGTREGNVKSILEEGLKEKYRKNQVYGGGEYFADWSNVSMGFCGGGTKMIVFAYLTDKDGRALNSDEETLRAGKKKGINVCSRIDYQCPLFTLEFPTAQFHADIVKNIAMPPIGYNSWEKWALATTPEVPPPPSMMLPRIQSLVDKAGEDQRVHFFRQQNGVKVGGEWPQKQYYVLQADMMEEALKLFRLEGTDDFSADWDEDEFHNLYSLVKPRSTMSDDDFIKALGRLVSVEIVRRIKDILFHKLLREPRVHFKKEEFPEKVPEPAPPPPPPPRATIHQVEMQAKGASYQARNAKRQAETEKAFVVQTTAPAAAPAAVAPAVAPASATATEAKVEAMKKQMQEMKRQMEAGARRRAREAVEAAAKKAVKKAAKKAAPRIPRPTRQS